MCKPGLDAYLVTSDVQACGDSGEDNHQEMYGAESRKAVSTPSKRRLRASKTDRWHPNASETVQWQQESLRNDPRLLAPSLRGSVPRWSNCGEEGMVR